MRYREREYTKRCDYLRNLREILKIVGSKNVVYLDESGFDDRKNYHDSGWAFKGKKIYGERSGNRFKKRQSLLLARRCKKLLSPMIFEGTCNKKLFNKWLEKMLIPEMEKLEQKQVIIMDNASIHKNKKTREIIENAGHILLYLPPYSPDFNPIEKFFGVLKRIMKNSELNLEDAIANF